jgi:hypothetical protein
MRDPLTVAAALLVLGPALGLFGFYDRAIWRVWMAPRDEHLRIVAAHRRGWTMVNVGFTVATVLTSGGLFLLAGAVDANDGVRAILAADAVAYLLGGTLWLAVLAVRTRTTPTIAGLVAAGSPTEPAEALLGAAVGGLFASFCLIVSGSLVVLGGALAVGGVVVPVGWLIAGIGALCVVWFLRTDDLIPAVLYIPTLILGLALLGGVS